MTIGSLWQVEWTWGKEAGHQDGWVGTVLLARWRRFPFGEWASDRDTTPPQPLMDALQIATVGRGYGRSETRFEDYLRSLPPMVVRIEQTPGCWGAIDWDGFTLDHATGFVSTP